MTAELSDLVWQYQVASEAERPGLLAQIRKLSDPAWRDHRDRLPPLMPCRKHGTERVELIDSKSWLFLCHECGELFQRNGDGGLAELLLEEEEENDDSVFGLLLDTKALLEDAESEWVSNRITPALCASVRNKLSAVPPMLERLLEAVRQAEADHTGDKENADGT